MIVKMTAAVVVASCATASSAQIVTLSANDIHNQDTTTPFFDNGELRLTPVVGGVPATFSGGDGRLGIDDFGTNANAFNDPDTDPNNGNEETLVFEFISTAGLTQLGWDFSRAERVEISGFIADPNASFSGRNFAPNGSVPNLSSTYDAMTGTLVFEIPFAIGFAGDDGFLDLANAAASAGQTLVLKVTDTQAAGAQLAITTISYNNAVPAPASAALLGLGGLAVARRRK